MDKGLCGGIEMTFRVFERWDWEHDRGEGPLSPASPLPRSHAIAYYDYADRLYRVVMKNRCDIVVAHHASEDETEVFDYCCDEAGKILEKRSLDEGGNVVLIVRFSYDDGRGLVLETGW